MRDKIEVFKTAKTCPRCSYEGHKIKHSEEYICTHCGKSWSHKIVAQPCPSEGSHEKPLQPVKNDYDERIREAFDGFSEECKDIPIWTEDVIFERGYKAGFKSRDKEVDKLHRIKEEWVAEATEELNHRKRLEDELTALRERIKEILSALDTTIEERDEYAKEIDEMKCCGNCGKPIDQRKSCTPDIDISVKDTYVTVCDNWKRRSDERPTN